MRRRSLYTVSRLLASAASAACAAAMPARALGAQPGAAPATALTRDDAVRTALDRAAQLGVARADTAVAYAQLLTAQTRANPSLSASYSKSVPTYHFSADLPIDYLGLRGARIRAAESGRVAARYRFVSARAAVALAADTAYTQAVAARERMRLSRANAVAADSLRGIAARRRDAGDASDLDVELASVNAAQQLNTALSDSLRYVSAVLDLQAAIGLASDGVAIVPTDSLGAPPNDAVPNASPNDMLPNGTAPNDASPLVSIAAAQASLESARLGTLAERRGIWATPSVTAGFESGDADQHGLLPTFGVSVPFPLLDRNRGPIALAEAERLRAESELALARVESRTEIARARRTLAVAQEKLRRDVALVASAARVATMSQTAYREGASALPAVLESQRSARDVFAQYVTDLADAWIASATLRALTLTVESPR